MDDAGRIVFVDIARPDPRTLGLEPAPEADDEDRDDPPRTEPAPSPTPTRPDVESPTGSPYRIA